MVVIMVRKKDLTRATKRHLPPMSAREQIVEGIVENLRPWKDGKSCRTVTAQVNEKLNELVKLASLLKKNTFDARRAGEYAKKLGKAIDKVEALLQSSPLRLWLRLFNPRTDMTGNFSKPPKPSESFEEMISGRKARAETVLAELARLRKRGRQEPSSCKVRNRDASKIFSFSVMTAPRLSPRQACAGKGR
jgi:hypothetical protein